MRWRKASSTSIPRSMDLVHDAQLTVDDTVLDWRGTMRITFSASVLRG